MALAPQNEETFFREVDEDLRRDRMETFVSRNGKWILLAVVALLAAVGGWIYWQHRQTLAAEAHSETLSQALADLSEGKEAGVKARLDGLAAASNDGYRGAALLTEASAALVRNDRAAALAGFAKVAGDSAVPQVMRDAALVRQTAIEYDTLPPATVIARLKTLAIAGNPWFGSAGEMVAIAYLRTNRPQDAGRIFAAIAKDETMPDSLRGRAVRVAGALGFDVPQRVGDDAR
ncbi:tetratricopeptide repeat protein [Sphingomonas montana]|uniref:tetratricopeptide repeat protein n=1 Tax=Sphingomonas montana TaxID=1843236 RepID=UPI00096C6C2F|nr:tetratricopeptide repeat protein [Sphingomonas montana]